MKIRDCGIQLVDIQVLQKQLELPKSLPRVADYRQVFRGVVGHRGNIIEQPPETAVIGDKVSAFHGMVKVEGDLLWRLVSNVLRHLINVRHHLLGLLEGIGVDPLDHVGFAGPILLAEVYLVRTVHVSHLDFLIGK